ncbi:ORFX protein [Brassica napus RNA virus 1]|uniref:ORFX protein n=1 Tax=Brassica napus RNA virus 1 TaxID=2419797 RepID=A0A386QX50_9SECO|nr:ORFX protein [Brassica napus RNA virus 1]AYE54583.1 ORFX protein [Brassica napus RNA virus 1]
MQRVLLIASLAINMAALFMQVLGLLLKQPIILIVGICVIMLNIFLNVLALVTKPEEDFSQFLERASAGTPLARNAERRAPLPVRERR